MGPADERIREAVRRFEKAWSVGCPYELREYVARYPDLAPQLLSELIPVDFTARWDAGQQVPVEVFLRDFPEFQEDSGVLMELLGVELLHAERLPDLGPFVARFPGLDREIRLLSQLIERMTWEIEHRFGPATSDDEALGGGHHGLPGPTA